jgi:pantothenate kinase-related protein Tda10
MLKRPRPETAPTLAFRAKKSKPIRVGISGIGGGTLTRHQQLHERTQNRGCLLQRTDAKSLTDLYRTANQLGSIIF